MIMLHPCVRVRSSSLCLRRMQTLRVRNLQKPSNWMRAKQGLLEAGKMRSIVALMKTRKLDWLALKETHMKQQDQYIIDGYTFTHSANEELDDNNKPKQTFAGVSVVTAPRLTPPLMLPGQSYAWQSNAPAPRASS